MSNSPSAFQIYTHWAKRLAPFVRRTLTLQRPIANARLRRQTHIASPGIDEDLALELNGHKQWLRIRGMDLSNPVLLYLHGGPGGSQIPSYRHYQLPWEQHFTVVQWEQRGSGRSYSSQLDPGTMTLTQLVADGLQLIDYLNERFPDQPMVLLGHSWGSMLGIHIAQQQPKNVCAYVGIGQVANQIASERRLYDFALEQAEQQQHAQALTQLHAIESYPPTGPHAHLAVGTVRRWARKFGFAGSNPDDTGRTYGRLDTTPEYSLYGIYQFLQGTLLSINTLGKVLMHGESAQPTELAKEFSIPVFCISGARDHFTPADLTDAYLKSLTAPAIEHVVFEESGHYPNEDEPERFLETLLALLQPHI